MAESSVVLFNDILRPDQIIPKNLVSERYRSDWTYENSCSPQCILLPETTEQVADILKICHAQKLPVVTQGGTTGLSGSATPKPGEISLSLERISGIEDIDQVGMSITVLAGTTLGDIHRALENTPCIYGVDYGARDLAQIGGNLSTNAGGTQVIRYGMSRAQVLGLEAVLADGTILSSMNKLLKNNAGYDLKQLFIGSEGTLGVITKIQLRMHPRPGSRCTALLALDSYDNCLMLLNLCRGIFAESLTGFEVMWKTYFDAACNAIDFQPFDTENSEQLYALVEVRGQNQQHDWARFEELFSQCQGEKIVGNGALAETPDEAEKLWNIRFAIKHILENSGKIAHFDIGIPTAEMQHFIDRVSIALTPAYPEAIPYTFGHVADGNIHLLIDPGEAEDLRPIQALVYPLCHEFGGTITAEHGVGVHKKTELLAQLSDAEIQLMRTLKRTLDPNNILNPGRVFDLN